MDASAAAELPLTSPGAPDRAPGRAGPAFALAGGLATIAATLVLSRRFASVDLLRFPLCWIGVLAALDGLGRLRHGASALPTARSWLFAAAGSLAFWDLFEVLNLRLQNWWYVGVSAELLPSAAFAAVSFATVLPAVRLGEAALRGRGTGPIARHTGLVLNASGKPPSTEAARPGALVPLLLGCLALALPLLAPRFAFPLAWLFLWPLAEGLLRALPPDPQAAPSPLESLAAGDRTRLPRLMAIGLGLGLVWESLNWGCARGWVYTVPFFSGGKLFEMPLPGYLGYLPFALECAAGLSLLDRLSRAWSRRAALGAALLLLGAHVGLEATAFPRSTLSTTREVTQARPGSLAQVARLGTANAARLRAAGIATPFDLAAVDPDELSYRLAAQGHALPADVLRLWVGAARRELR